jgi:hypothetical protein
MIRMVPVPMSGLTQTRLDMTAHEQWCSAMSAAMSEMQHLVRKTMTTNEQNMQDLMDLIVWLEQNPGSSITDWSRYLQVHERIMQSLPKEEIK